MNFNRCSLFHTNTKGDYNKMIKQILKHPESRKLEFKETLPEGKQIAQTAISFSNGPGGEIYIGIKDQPRKITGLPENKLFAMEEKISSIIADNCYPLISPDINFINHKGKHIIKVKIYRGSQVPYYLKSKGRENGTYIRVGSSNRRVDAEIIQELERQRHNITYDSLPFYEIDYRECDLISFKDEFQKKTKKTLDEIGLLNLNILKKEQGQLVPTVAAVLFANKTNKNRHFPYAKIECARFKGTTMEEFIDQITIDEPLFLQPELALAFIKRNIKKGSTIGEIYRVDRWEYPLDAIRELLINAVAHRDYSQQGRDVKVAIFDDMIEITSPGSLPNTIDIEKLDSGQSEIRNKVIALVFKNLQLIEQWGTGFKKVMTYLKDYPELQIKFLEPGLSFQVQLINTNYSTGFSQIPEKYPSSIPQATPKYPLSTPKYLSNTPQVPPKYSPSTPQVISDRKTISSYVMGANRADRHKVQAILEFCLETKNRNEIQKHVGLKDRKYFRVAILNPIIEQGFVALTIPDKPNSPKQRYITTENGRQLLAGL